MNPLYFVRYEPKLMLADCLDLSPAAELAHRRLCDWVWIQGRGPVAEAKVLQQITRVLVGEWARVYPALKRKGWRRRSGVLEHDGVLRSLAEARAAHASAVERGRAGAQCRWHGAPAKAEPRQAVMPPLTQSDPQSEPKTLSVKPAERLTLSSAAHSNGADGEDRFMDDLREALDKFDRQASVRELTTWGGWWRNRYRENPEKAGKVLAELRGMIREHKIRRNPGAAAKDLWGRLP